MADLKISELTNLTAADPISDMLPIVDVSATPPASGSTKRISINNLLSSSPTASGALTVTGLVTAGSATITGALTSGTTTLVSHAAGYTGKVGIGTATPTVTLDVVGAARFVAAATGPKLSIENAGGSTRFKSTDTSSFYYSAYDHNFTNTAGTVDRLVIANSGDVTVSTGNVVMGTSGKGIDFGVTTPDGTGTVTAELLNDYEEGTWTGTLKGSVSNPATLVTATGKYTKVGRQVTVSIYYNSVDTTGYSGNVTIDGLPFTGSESFAGSSITFGLFATSTTLASWNVSTSIAFYITGNFVQATHSPGAGRYLTTTITYFV